jgi:hypothetical protein
MWKNCKVLDLIRCAHFFHSFGGAGRFLEAQKILETIFGSKLAEISERQKRKDLETDQTDEVSDAGDLYADLESSPHNPRLSPTLDLVRE